MKRGIIFDMDGTLWDSAENVAKSWNVAIRQYGVREKELTTQDIQGVMGKTMDVIADILFAEFPEEKRRLLLKECCQVENDYLREHTDTVPAPLTLQSKVTAALEKSSAKLCLTKTSSRWSSGLVNSSTERNKPLMRQKS